MAKAKTTSTVRTRGTRIAHKDNVRAVPGYQAKKFATQLRNKHTCDANGVATPLTPTQAAYRMGYIGAVVDSSEKFKEHNPGYERKTGKK